MKKVFLVILLVLLLSSQSCSFEETPDTVNVQIMEDVQSISVALYTSDNISVPNNALKLIPFDLERYDLYNMHINGDTRITIPANGLYLISLWAVFDQNTTGRRIEGIRKNGSIYVMNSELSLNSAGYANSGVTGIVRLITGDYIEATAYQTSGDILKLRVYPEYSIELSITRIGN